MPIDKNKAIINSVESAVKWFKDSEIHGIKVERVKASKVVFKYRTSVTDKKIVTRFYNKH